MTRSVKLGKKDHAPWRYRNGRKRKDELVMRELSEMVETPEDSRFTEQQIQDHIDKVENLCLICRNEGALMFESVQIIKQLISECPKYSKSHNVEQFYDE